MPQSRIHERVEPGFPDYLVRCLTPAADGPISVQVITLASLLGALGVRRQVALLKVDAQGGDLDVIVSAGAELQRVRWLQVEVQDLPRGDPRMLYGPQQYSKMEVVKELASRGFILDVCTGNSEEVREEDCIFVRADLLGTPPDDPTLMGHTMWAALQQLSWDDVIGTPYYSYG